MPFPLILPATLHKKCPQCRHKYVFRVHRRPFEKVLTKILQIKPYRCDVCGFRFYYRFPVERGKRLSRAIAQLSNS